MSDKDPLDLDRIDQEIRINELKEEASELAGGEMHAWDNPDCPPGIAEQFWNNVVAFEKAPRSCDFLRLEEMGVALPPPDEVADADLPAKLREIFQALATISTYFIHTDHLSDRELYVHLWEETLREITVVMPPMEGSCNWYDLVSSGSDDDIHAWLKHYADEETRQQWAKDFPNNIIPPHEDPPYDRDRHLPQEPDERRS